MNNWLNELNTHLQDALTILLVTTAVLIAGLAMQHAVRRSPAARHAVLLWTLIEEGLCPILISAMRLAPISADRKSRRDSANECFVWQSHDSTKSSQQQRPHWSKTSPKRRIFAWLVDCWGLHKPVGTGSRLAHHQQH